MINTRLGKFIFRDANLKKIFNKIYWGRVLASHPSCFAMSEKDINMSLLPSEHCPLNKSLLPTIINFCVCQCLYLVYI